MRFFLILIFFSISVFSQTKKNAEIIYILDEGGFVNTDLQNRLHYLINIDREGSEFDSDGYKFTVPNQLDFENFLKFKEIRKKVNLDTISFYEVSELKKMDTCDLHDFFSRITMRRRQIYAIIKEKNTYYTFPINYKGTQKNLNMLRQKF
ncbi:MAG: hypothetical protein ABR595_08895 [Psychroflexus sp.]